MYSVLCNRLSGISIHAPREGSDKAGPLPQGGVLYFYPRSPRGERRSGMPIVPSRSHFYPRSPRGERQQLA